MAYKVKKSELKSMGNKELIRIFEECIAESVKEANFSMRGVTKITHDSLVNLRCEILERLGDKDGE